MFLGFDANGDLNGFEQGKVKRGEQAHAGNGGFRQCRRDGLRLGAELRSIGFEPIGGSLGKRPCAVVMPLALAAGGILARNVQLPPGGGFHRFESGRLCHAGNVA